MSVLPINKGQYVLRDVVCRVLILSTFLSCSSLLDGASDSLSIALWPAVELVG